MNIKIILCIVFLIAFAIAGSAKIAHPKYEILQKLSHSEALKRIKAAGIGISSSGNCYNRNNPKCTSLEQVRVNTINMIITLKKSSGCPITITGGTETGHASGTKSHWNGYKLDISLNSCINSYIKNSFTYIGKRSDGAQQWKSSAGSIYALEGNHWDILYP